MRQQAPDASHSIVEASHNIVEASPIVCKTQQGGMIDEVKDKDDEEATRDLTEINRWRVARPSFILVAVADHRASSRD